MKTWQIMGYSTLSKDVLLALTLHLLLVVLLSRGNHHMSKTPVFHSRFRSGTMRVTAVNLGVHGGRYERTNPAHGLLSKKYATNLTHAVPINATVSSKKTKTAHVKNSGLSSASSELNKTKINHKNKETVQATSNALNQHLTRYVNHKKQTVAKNKTLMPNDRRMENHISQVGQTKKISGNILRNVNNNVMPVETKIGAATNATNDANALTSRVDYLRASAADQLDQLFTWEGMGESGAGLVGVVEEYQQEIMQTISYFWKRPEGLADNEYCCYLVDIAVDGHVTRMQLERSSGNRYLNASAKAAITASDPLPVPEDQDLYQQFKHLRLIFRGNGSLGGSN